MKAKPKYNKITIQRLPNGILEVQFMETETEMILTLRRKDLDPLALGTVIHAILDGNAEWSGHNQATLDDQ